MRVAEGRLLGVRRTEPGITGRMLFPVPAHAQRTACLYTSRRRGPVLSESHFRIDRFEPGLDDIKDR